MYFGLVGVDIPPCISTSVCVSFSCMCFCVCSHVLCCVCVDVCVSGSLCFCVYLHLCMCLSVRICVSLCSRRRPRKGPCGLLSDAGHSFYFLAPLMDTGRVPGGRGRASLLVWKPPGVWGGRAFGGRLCPSVDLECGSLWVREGSDAPSVVSPGLVFELSLNSDGSGPALRGHPVHG